MSTTPHGEEPRSGVSNHGPSRSSLLTRVIIAADQALTFRRVCDGDDTRLAALIEDVRAAHARLTDEQRVTTWAALMMPALKIFAAAQRLHDEATTRRAAQVIGVIKPLVAEDAGIALELDRTRRHHD
jgi:hypothetical protein